MPCYDAESAAEDKYNREQVPKLTAKVHDLTDKLCRLCQYVERYSGSPIADKLSMNQDIKDWWHAHQEADRKRGGK